MTQAPQSQTAGNARFKSPSSGQEDRLSARQREVVAEKLLHDATVSRVYADDIISCVADMVPNLHSELRLAFVLKLYDFIFRCGHFDGRDALKVFGGSFLTMLGREERSHFFGTLKAGLKADHVLSCEAHAWGIVHIAPVLEGDGMNEALSCLTGPAVRSALGSRTRDIVARFVLNMEGGRRADAARFLCGLIRRENARETLSDLVDVLTAITPALRDEDRVFVADAVAPLIFDTDAHVVRKALGYFTAAVRLLPVPHRLPFALMLTGLLKDVALSDDVVEALKRIEPSLATPEERARVEFALSFAEGLSEGGGGLLDFATPYMSPD